jgi:hypothetical protein
LDKFKKYISFFKIDKNIKLKIYNEKEENIINKTDIEESKK